MEGACQSDWSTCCDGGGSSWQPRKKICADLSRRLGEDREITGD